MSASPPTSSPSSSAAGVPLLSAAPSSTNSHGDCTACHSLGRSIPAAAPYSGSQPSLSERARIIQVAQVTAALDHEVLDLQGRLDVTQDLLEASGRHTASLHRAIHDRDLEVQRVRNEADGRLRDLQQALNTEVERRQQAEAAEQQVRADLARAAARSADADEVTLSAAASPSNVVPSQLEIALGDLDDLRAVLADIKSTWTPPPTASVGPGGRLLAASEAATDDDRTSDGRAGLALQRSNAERDRSRNQLRQAEATIDRLQTELAQSRTLVNKAAPRMDALRLDAFKAREDAEAARREAAAASKKAQDGATAVSDLAQRHKVAGKRLEELERKITRLTQHNTVLRRENVVFKNSLEHRQADLATAQDRAVAAERERAEASLARDDLQAELDASRQSLLKEQASSADLRSKLAEREEHLGALRNLINLVPAPTPQPVVERCVASASSSSSLATLASTVTSLVSSDPPARTSSQQLPSGSAKRSGDLSSDSTSPSKRAMRAVATTEGAPAELSSSTAMAQSPFMHAIPPESSEAARPADVTPWLWEVVAGHRLDQLTAKDLASKFLPRDWLLPAGVCNPKKGKLAVPADYRPWPQPSVEALYKASPWKIFLDNMPDPISFDIGDPRFQPLLAIIRDVLTRNDNRGALVFWKITHSIEISISKASAESWEVKFTSDRKNRRSHFVKMLLPVFEEVARLCKDYVCELDILLEPFFLPLVATCPWFPKGASGEAVRLFYWNARAKHPPMNEPIHTRLRGKFKATSSIA
ncbi:hypothetical protein PHYSODRAFT_320941 [Phytophthora sojae]|uniref:Cytochrome c domain-containing protein n=1 Tax=Phytophthora sojae (strain P6497) TaxID=1094619 RepID=G4YJW2_PHYSP|nr:hypothetical protein PHYSODRAFT_320941 [Phytophthora sojae]EGZ27094.1 hypothetical protein PHYSODRAFT_320941 [Phytophthora sojae]|eukprot:XP_009514369.1 hypothetical protein PHYSODRAFT_320941 [Phytophthora sojae]